MRIKLFRTKAEIVTLFVIAFSISWLFTPIIEHIYTTTDWNDFSITEIADRIQEYRDDLKQDRNK